MLNLLSSHGLDTAISVIRATSKSKIVMIYTATEQNVGNQ